MFAKGVAATAPPVLLTWLSFGILLVGLRLIAPPAVFAYSARGVWIVGMLLFSPLLAFLSVLVGVMVSSRINDPRAAQQIAGIFVLPLIGISLVVLAGLIYIDVPMMLGAAGVVVIGDGIVLYFAVKLFDRETILTRWK